MHFYNDHITIVSGQNVPLNPIITTFFNLIAITKYSDAFGNVRVSFETISRKIVQPLKTFLLFTIKK